MPSPLSAAREHVTAGTDHIYIFALSYWNIKPFREKSEVLDGSTDIMPTTCSIMDSFINNSPTMPKTLQGMVIKVSPFSTVVIVSQFSLFDMFVWITLSQISCHSLPCITSLLHVTNP